MPLRAIFFCDLYNTTFRTYLERIISFFSNWRFCIYLLILHGYEHNDFGKSEFVRIENYVVKGCKRDLEFAKIGLVN